MEWLVDVLPVMARVCLVVIFPFSGLDKIFNWGSALKQGNQAFCLADRCSSCWR